MTEKISNTNQRLTVELVHSLLFFVWDNPKEKFKLNFYRNEFEGSEFYISKLSYSIEDGRGRQANVFLNNAISLC